MLNLFFFVTWPLMSSIMLKNLRKSSQWICLGNKTDSESYPSQCQAQANIRNEASVAAPHILYSAQPCLDTLNFFCYATAVKQHSAIWKISHIQRPDSTFLRIISKHNFLLLFALVQQRLWSNNRPLIISSLTYYNFLDRFTVLMWEAHSQPWTRSRGHMSI